MFEYTLSISLGDKEGDIRNGADAEDTDGGGGCVEDME